MPIGCAQTLEPLTLNAGCAAPVNAPGKSPVCATLCVD
jgi:hypothetical protein